MMHAGLLGVLDAFRDVGRMSSDLDGIDVSWTSWTWRYALTFLAIYLIVRLIVSYIPQVNIACCIWQLCMSVATIT